MNETKSTLQESIARQRESLILMLKTPIRELAKVCAGAWPERNKLNEVLQQGLLSIPGCEFLYVLDNEGVQISDNSSRHGLIEKDFARDRSDRPYMLQVTPETEFLLSGAYISLRVRRPSLTAIQRIDDEQGQHLGYLGADFDLRDLPLTRELYEEPRYWRQIKGDPSIRGTVFNQTRSESVMDQHLDTILSVVEELMTDRGVFHVILHFSSSRAIIWLMDDPYRYRLLDIDSLIEPDICLAYPRCPYPDDALIPAEKISEVLEGFRQLRYMDEMFYLRSGTMNIFNGVIGLTFSCDGSHYIPFDEFLDKQHTFWLMGITGSA